METGQPSVPIWRLTSLWHARTSKAREDVFIGKVSLFRHRKETVSLSSPGLYRFNASLPHDLNISKSFLLSKLRAHEYVKRISAPGSRWSLAVKVTVTSQYASLVNKVFVIEPGNAVSDFFHIPRAFTPATCTLSFRGFAFRLLLVTSSLHFEAPVEENAVHVQQLQRGISGGGIGEEPSAERVKALAKQLLNSIGEGTSHDAQFERGLESVEETLAEHVNVVRYDKPGHTLICELHIKQICSFLPKSLRNALWTQRFDSYVDGSSLDQLVLKCCAREENQVLFIQDTQGFLFGGYLANGLYVDPNQRRGSYMSAIGDGQNFVFSFKDAELHVYAWKQTNEMFRLLSDSGLGLGGGGDGFALWINSTLSAGTSSASATFENVELAHAQSFIIQSVEVWAINSGLIH